MVTRSRIVVGLSILLIAGCSVASADTIQSWYITDSSGQNAVPCTASAPCAQVTLDLSGMNASFTVSSLLNGYIFDTFGFKTANGVNVSLLSAMGEVGSYSLGGPAQQAGFGDFKYVFDTGKNGGSSGGDCMNHGSGCTFTFNLSSSSSLTLADFEVVSAVAMQSLFAGHLAADGGNSGYVGGTEMITQISEPTTIAVLFSGLLSGAGLLARKVFSVKNRSESYR